MVSDKLCAALAQLLLTRLNPYCNGTWSLTPDAEKAKAYVETIVLILIVMEHGL